MILGLGLLNQAHRRSGTELFEARVGARLVRMPGPWQWRVYTRGVFPPEWEGITGFEEVVCPPVGRMRGGRLWSEQVSWARELGRRPVELLLSLAFSPPARQRCPTLLTVHDLTPIERPRDFPPMTTAYWRWLLRAAVPRARRIATPSSWVRSRCADVFGFPEERIDVVYSGIEPKYFRETERGEATPALARLGVERPFWFHCGTVQPRKNLEVLVRALSILRSRNRPVPQLVNVGGDASHAHRILRLARDLGVADRLLLAGPRDDETLAALYQSCAAFVYPSWIEGFGVPPLEAMASGTPVVAARASCLPEILGDVPRWADPAEPETWIAAWDDLGSENGSDGDERARRGRSWARRYTWDDTATRCMESLRRSLNEST